jgi:hypothetical protein
MNQLRAKLPCLDIIISKYQPSGIIKAWLFRQRLKAVLKEAGSNVLSDEKLTQFQQQYGGSIKGKSREDFNIMTSDMVMEYRRLIGAESYISILKRMNKQ